MKKKHLFLGIPLLFGAIALNLNLLSSSPNGGKFLRMQALNAAGDCHSCKDHACKESSDTYKSNKENDKCPDSGGGGGY